MEKIPNNDKNVEHMQDDQGALDERWDSLKEEVHFDADGNESLINKDTYRENIEPYLNNNRRQNSIDYRDCLLDYDNYTSMEVGGTFNADKRVAQRISQSINGASGQIKIEQDIVEDSEERFFVDYSEDNKTLRLCYGKKWDPVDTYQTLKPAEQHQWHVKNEYKYTDFFKIACELWRVHQADNPNKYSSFNEEQLNEEAKAFAASTLIDGMDLEQKYWSRKETLQYLLPLHKLNRERSGNINYAKSTYKKMTHF